MESSLLMPREDEIVDQEEVNLLELAVVLLKRKRLILAVASGLAVLTLVLCLVITPIYQGTAQILPPSEDSATSSILSQLSGAAGAAVGLLGVSTAPSALTYVGILKSNTVFDAIIDQFGLMDVFRNNRFLGRWRNYYREDARDDLLDITKIELDTESNMISISVQDENPNKSAKIANSFVTELKNILHSIDVAEATQRRSFFLGQFKQTLQDVTKAEEELKRFEQATGAIQLDEQARAVLAGIAALEAQAAAKEIELKVMKTYATERNPDLMRVCLPIATLPTGRYFVDLRLGEFRQVENPFNVVRFGSDAGQDMCRRANVASCPSCGTHVIASGTTRQGEFSWASGVCIVSTRERHALATQTLYRKPFPLRGRPTGLKVYRRVRSTARLQTSPGGSRDWANRHRAGQPGG